MNASFTYKRNNSTGFTLVELLVVITIIGILMSLLLPAVNAARESARQMQCKNQLKQLALAMQTHNTQNSWLPAGGWYNWTGDPDRGFSRTQPGGWLYNILPYCELQALHDMGANIDSASSSNSTKMKLIGRANATPTKFFHCPTRRPSQGYPASKFPSNMDKGNLTLFAKTDYAANGGNFVDTFDGSGAPTGDSKCYGDETNCPWYRGKNKSYSEMVIKSNGVVRRSDVVTTKEIRDGASHTIAVAEKYLAPEYYETGTALNDDSVAFIGWDCETVRFGPYFDGQDGRPEKYDGWQTYEPVCDKKNSDSTNANARKPRLDTRGIGTGISTPYFGSSHAAFFNAAMLDGSVRSVKYAINLEIFGCLCNRADGVGIGDGDQN